MNFVTIDPFEKAHWTLAEAFAWITWRKPQYVIICGGPDGMNSLEASVSPGNEFDRGPFISRQRAEELLKLEASKGAIIANALSVSTGEAVAIPANEWPHLNANASHDGGALYSGPVTPMYTDILLERETVLRLWPAFEPGKNSLPAHKVTLFEAVLCIARNGNDLTNDQIVALGLFEPSSKLLFQMLHLKEATATGRERQTQTRSQNEALHPYWEDAYDNPGIGPQDGHYVCFTDDRAFDGSGFGGTLTPHSEHEPRWVDIQVEFQHRSQSDHDNASSPALGSNLSRGRPPNETLEGYRDWISIELAEHRIFGAGQKYKSERRFATVVKNKIEEEMGIAVELETVRSHVRRILKEIMGTSMPDKSG